MAPPTPACTIEPEDFSFSTAYASPLPLSPSSPTPLPSHPWQAPTPLTSQDSDSVVTLRPVPHLQSPPLRSSTAASTSGQEQSSEQNSLHSERASLSDEPRTNLAAESGASVLKGPSQQPEPSSKALGNSHSRPPTDSGGAHDPVPLNPVVPMKAPKERKKVPYEKGFSQMDWLKLTQTHPDLAGLQGGPRRRIKMEEVRLHKSEDDSWTVLQGKVFNITPYFNFHPGGKKMLKLAAGKDCTDLFNKYHMWVNADFLLEKCWLGILDS